MYTNEETTEPHPDNHLAPAMLMDWTGTRPVNRVGQYLVAWSQEDGSVKECVCGSLSSALHRASKGRFNLQAGQRLVFEVASLHGTSGARLRLTRRVMGKTFTGRHTLTGVPLFEGDWILLKGSRATGKGKSSWNPAGEIQWDSSKKEFQITNSEWEESFPLKTVKEILLTEPPDHAKLRLEFLGKRIEFAREEKNWGRQEFAARLNTCPHLLEEVETSGTGVSLDLMMKILDTTGKDLKFFTDPFLLLPNEVEIRHTRYRTDEEIGESLRDSMPARRRDTPMDRTSLNLAICRSLAG